MSSGIAQHNEAVRRLQQSYAAVPADAPVRLAKRTSNLFRPRDAVPSAGLEIGKGATINDPRLAEFAFS